MLSGHPFVYLLFLIRLRQHTPQRAVAIAALVRRRLAAGSFIIDPNDYYQIAGRCSISQLNGGTPLKKPFLIVEFDGTGMDGNPGWKMVNQL
jgi:hypothetical protein